jgi:hypothetical protein
VSGDTGNGIPIEEADDSDTGRIRAALFESTSDAGIAVAGDGVAPTVDEIAIAAIKHLTGGGGNGNAGKMLSKPIKLILLILGMLVGSGGIVTTIYLTETRSEDNQERVEENAVAIEEIDQELGEVKESVDDVGDKLDEQYKVQVLLVEGIETLKEEAQTSKQQRLEDEVKRLRRENRALERRPR